MKLKAKIKSSFLPVFIVAVMAFLLLPITALAISPGPPFHISGSDTTNCNDLYTYQNVYDGYCTEL